MYQVKQMQGMPPARRGKRTAGLAIAVGGAILLVVIGAVAAMYVFGVFGGRAQCGTLSKNAKAISAARKVVPQSSGPAAASVPAVPESSRPAAAPQANKAALPDQHSNKPATPQPVQTAPQPVQTAPAVAPSSAPKADEWVTCTRCQGPGHYPCPACHGTGQIQLWVTCQTCNGSKVDGSGQPCAQCNGTGGHYIPYTCKICLGVKNFPCPDCNGTGKVPKR